MTEKCMAYQVETRLVSSDTAYREIEKLSHRLINAEWEIENLKRVMMFSAKHLELIADTFMTHAEKNGAVKIVAAALQQTAEPRSIFSEDDDFPF